MYVTMYIECFFKRIFTCLLHFLQLHCGGIVAFSNVFLWIVAKKCGVLTDGQYQFSWTKHLLKGPSSPQPAPQHATSLTRHEVTFQALSMSYTLRLKHGARSFWNICRRTASWLLDLQKSFPGTKSSKNLDWKVRWLFCGVNFQGLFVEFFFGVRGEGRIFCWSEDVEGKVGEG